jgi:hypothetical protein
MLDRSFDRDLTMGFNGDLIALLLQKPQKWKCSPLEQGFTSGEKDMFYTGFFDLKEDRIKIHPDPAFKAVRGIAIGATEVAASESHKDKGNSAERGLALK